MTARILVADDNVELRTTLRDYLQSKGHRIFEADDGAQAFAVAEKEMPHLIITDVVMPGVYGTAATRKLQDYWRTAKIPVIVISGSVEAAMLSDLLKSPLVRFLKKPVNLAVLDKTIQELLPAGGYTP